MNIYLTDKNTVVSGFKTAHTYEAAKQLTDAAPLRMVMLDATEHAVRFLGHLQGVGKRPFQIYINPGPFFDAVLTICKTWSDAGSIIMAKTDDSYRLVS